MSADPDAAEDLVAEGDDEVGGGGDPDTEPELLLYRILHDEVRAHLSHQFRSLLSGLSVVGVIIAYALLSGELVFMAVIPLVVGFLIVQTVRQLNNVLFAAQHLNRIEDAYVDDHPLFSWEQQFGMTGTDRRVERYGINWAKVPQALILTIAILGYFAFVYVAYVVWPPAGVDVLTVGLDRNGLLGIYALFTALVSLSGYSYYLHVAELTPDTE